MKAVTFIISGEGKTDLGQNNLDFFALGPVCYIIDSLYEHCCGFSPIECGVFADIFSYISETDLKAESHKRKKNHKTLFLPSKKYQQGTLSIHSVLALTLGLMCKEKSNDSISVIPIFFRDADTNDIKDYKTILDSMYFGFDRAGFTTKRVAMLAKPKSEAWFLCFLDNYGNGKKYENGPGNDASPNSLKKQLDDELGGGNTTAKLIEKLDSEKIDVLRLSQEMMSIKNIVDDFERIFGNYSLVK